MALNTDPPRLPPPISTRPGRSASTQQARTAPSPTSCRHLRVLRLDGALRCGLSICCIGGRGEPMAELLAPERVLRRDRLIVGVGVAGGVALAWVYLVAGAGIDAGMARMPVEPMT